MSRQSGRVTFPNSAKSALSEPSVLSDELVSKENPFKMPPDSDIFLLRDKERQKKKQVSQLNKYACVHTVHTVHVCVCVCVHVCVCVVCVCVCV